MEKRTMEKGFTFEEGYFDLHCDFCGKRYESLGVQVSFAFGYEICPSCLLKGPKVVASDTMKRPAREFHSVIRRWFMSVKGFANQLKNIDDFRDLPGGVLAVKIAEAYRDTGNLRGRRNRKAA
ncbi:MAG: hypothetical protein ACYC37_03435 [Desulfobacteria bacterium]